MTLQSNNPVAPLAQQEIVDIPVKIVGGNKFGRYSKISAEATYNMIVSDDALVPYAGYKSILKAPVILGNGAGRGLYASTDGNFMIAVIGNNFYRIDPFFNATLLNESPMATESEDVYITENNGGQIVITDGLQIYVYNWKTGVVSSTYSTFANTFTFPWGDPGYCSFQNGRVIISVINTQYWVLSALNDATSWPNEPANQGAIQSKPGFVQAALPVPGGGNNLLVFGSTVAESWTDQGLALFPYQKTTAFNVDYGVLNPSSIAGLDNFIFWISTNEISGPTVMFSNGGGQVKAISTDGIDFILAQVKNPSDVTGFLFRQDGHLIYQFTFHQDNLSLAYDYETNLFFYVTDYNLNYHPARQVVFFNGSYYFVSFNDQNVYQFDTSITNVEVSSSEIYEIPRIRITPPLRLPTQRYFILRSVGFTIEQGRLNPENGSSAAVALSISRNGGVSYGNYFTLPMNDSGNYFSRFIWQRLGIANDSTFQFKFVGFNRFVALDGVAEVFQ